MIDHVPVLKNEVLKYLQPKPNENFIDCTFGGGGHTLAILEKILPKGRLLGIDRDEELIRRLKIKNNLILVCDNYANLKEIVKKYKFQPVNGILFDLGFSSWHIEKSGRGFSFIRNEFLDMRYSIKSQIPNSKIQNELTAEKIVNQWPQEKIEEILREYGQERFSKRIAREIISQRKRKPTKTTFDLVNIIEKAVPFKYRSSRLHCATRTFQAIRIVVNQELDNLKKVLPQALEILSKEGRMVVISFHSLEDRIVKNFFKENKDYFKLTTKKPILPSKREIKINPRSRSAKLRAAIKR